MIKILQFSLFLATFGLFLPINPLQAQDAPAPAAAETKVEAKVEAPKIHLSRPKAINDGIAWLASVQREDGSWAASLADEAGDVQVTALALISLIANNNTEVSGTHSAKVMSAVTWLINHQSEKGSLSENAFSHTLATLALCESYHTSGGLGHLGGQAAAEKAIAHLISQQQPSGEWGKLPDSSLGSTHSTAWALLALNSAITAKLTVERSVILKGLSALQRATHGSAQHEIAPGITPGEVNVPGDVSSTLIGLAVKRFYKMKMKMPPLPKGLAWLDKQAYSPSSLKDRDNKSFGFYDPWVGMLLYMHTGGAGLNAWRSDLEKVVLPAQVQPIANVEQPGSWPAPAANEGYHKSTFGSDIVLSRTSQTCVNILALSAYPRHAKLLMGRGK